jgi:hypothetical protein
MKTQKRRLMWHGMLHFLFGLITGLLEQRFTNVRMGLSAHLVTEQHSMRNPRDLGIVLIHKCAASCC